jgi:ubiquinone/menaquinone biosynthesis C-methylase UbiE
VLAIDIDRNMLDVARDRLTKAGTTNCEFVEGDAYELTTL